MKPWANADPAQYASLDLRAHAIMAELAPYEVWTLDLPGGGAGRTVADVRALALTAKPNMVVNGLFALRRLIGRVLDWDRDDGDELGLFMNRLTEKDRVQSVVPCGSKDGPFTLLYLHSQEAMSEIRNKTVHAALVWALRPRSNGYRLYWGVYVRPVGALTSMYMNAIKPFRHWLVYPSLLRRLLQAWCAAYATSVSQEGANTIEEHLHGQCNQDHSR